MVSSGIGRIIGSVFGIIEGLLAVRLILVLLGANPLNALANFVYSTSAPLIRPFVGLFSRNPAEGVIRVEFETIIAMLVYALLGWILVQVFSVGSRRRKVVH